MKTEIIKNITSPLCFLTASRMLCFNNGKFIVMCGGNEEKNIPILLSKKERLLGRWRLPSRLLRLGIRATIALDDNHVVFSRGSSLYEMDIARGTISKGWYCGSGIRPLTFTAIKGIEGFDDAIYFGGYLGNLEKKPVNIYKRKGIDEWEVVYTFGQGEIFHVHNIVADQYRKCVWIFTGDFDESAAIWKATDNFKKVERFAYNDQKYRACVAYALPEGLLYATDTPFADDYIYLLNPDTKETRELFPIHGSCIYGCKWKDQYVFSSTVEGDYDQNMSRLEWMFTRKRGAGIKDEFVHMYIGNLQEGFKEIYKEKKDSMPYYTFQFGAFKFPAGANNGDILYFQPIATRKHDMDLMAISW